MDVIIELADGRIIAIEVKATSAPSWADARHLIRLREHVGDRVLAALVLHAGPHLYPLSDEVYAVPIYSLWAP